MAALLSSWNDTPTRKVILDFIARVTDEASPNYVPVEERIAVFDNDGTLWCEKPMYIQLDFLLRKLVAKAELDPSLQEKQPWKAAWEKDFSWLGDTITKHYQGDDSDLHVLLKGILSLSHDQPVEKIETEAKDFVYNERHPTLGNIYMDCIYQPMIELLHYLEDHGFANYIVSGGGRDFMRGFASELYGIPRQRVIGSTVAYRYLETGDGCEIVQQADLDVIDDGPGKAIQIWNVIGRRPILAAGNSNGDIEMLKFTQSSGKPNLNLLLLHDDSQREFDYQQGAEKALELAVENDWQLISMKEDFKHIFLV
jgi:phosphoglycolate phosphatase-like HAD superfamily hydrolase